MSVTSKLASVAPVKKLSRQEKAAATRRRMLDAAYELFCDPGYRATTMADIAARAGVAVQTLYFTFHTKDDLLQAVQDRLVVGDDAVPPQLQPWHVAALAEPDVRHAVPMLVTGTQAIFERVAPLVPTFHSVAAEPAGDVWRHSEELRLDGYRLLVAHLAAKAPLRTGLTIDAATDVLFVVLGPECYRTFVIDRGWTVAAWIDWTAATLLRDLFGLEPVSGPRRRRPTLAG